MSVIGTMFRPVGKLRKARGFLKLFWWWNLINLTEFPVDIGPTTEIGATEYYTIYRYIVQYLYLFIN